MNIKNIKPIIDELEIKIEKAILRLDKSLSKVKKMSPIHTETSDEELEVWDSFAARFARLTDIFLAKYLRAKIYKTDPAFKGTMIDVLEYSIQQGWISDTQRWMAIRELRNKEAHEYNEDTLVNFYNILIIESDFVISETKKNILKK